MLRHTAAYIGLPQVGPCDVGTPTWRVRGVHHGSRKASLTTSPASLRTGTAGSFPMAPAAWLCPGRGRLPASSSTRAMDLDCVYFARARASSQTFVLRMRREEGGAKESRMPQIVKRNAAEQERGAEAWGVGVADRLLYTYFASTSTAQRRDGVQPGEVGVADGVLATGFASTSTSPSQSFR